MEINYNIISIIDIFGCLNGIVLGSILLYTNRKKDRSTLFLALFVLTYSYSFVPIILKDMNILYHFPTLQLLPRPGEWLLASIFFVYVQKVSIFSHRKIAYWCLYPGLFVLLLQIVIFLLPLNIKLQISDSFWYRPLFLVALIYSTGILIYMWRFIGRHSNEVENQYTQVEYKQLLWVKRFVLFGFGLFVLHFIRYFVKDSIGYRILYASANVFMLYWASIHGVMQQNVLAVVADDSADNPSANIHSTDAISIEELKKIVRSVDNYLSETEVFRDKNLTIINIAEALKIHPKRISKAINKVCNQNFNAHINQYRVKKAEKLLVDEELSNLSIEGIGIEAGFHSKSAFYSAFKKITGTTPNRYKAKLAS